ncbi:breast cancer type 2 susceptibility protein homolog [Wyeomyia smithii]|uniref:breast cancer type 2 susceptibility protein homolog n=1 Tax=Wyeomyia smithii TaxID=174621 RepID=UPI002467B485|nr:breast cancer type 2 susceptibility protein homolog [Wyeomyia smithii]
MEEVPASPEIVKRLKRRRTTGQFSRRTRLSLNRDKVSNSSNSVLLSDSVNIEQKTQHVPVKLENLLYFDDNTETGVLPDEDPLLMAAIIEKADQLEVEHRSKQSVDFMVNVKNKFIKIDEIVQSEEIAVKVEPTVSDANCSKKGNYSYTQFELNTEMLGVFEAADELAKLNSIPDQEPNTCWNSTPDQEAAKVAIKLESSEQSDKTPIRRRRDRWKDVRKSSLAREGDTTGDASPSVKHKNANNFDFSDDSDVDLTIDYSKIVSSKLRARLAKIQSFIDSPPQKVNKKSVHRTFSKKKVLNDVSITPPVIRRLSYESRDSSSDSMLEVDRVLSSSDDEFNHLDGSQGDVAVKEVHQVHSTSPVGDNFDSSLLIKANIDQLSQFFSTSVSERVQKQKRDSDSLSNEPECYGFPAEPMSPISLSSCGSPCIVSVAWLFRSESESDLSEETTFVHEDQSKPPLHHLLDEDDDFLSHLPTSQKTYSEYEVDYVSECDVRNHVKEKALSAIFKNYDVHSAIGTCYSTGNQAETCSYDGAPEAPVCAGFRTAGGHKIGVSEKAMRKAHAIWDDEINKLNGDENWLQALRDENGTCAESDAQPGPSAVGFKTAGGHSLTISKSALAKANALWSDIERDEYVDNKLTNVELNAMFNSPVVRAVSTTYPAVGFQTAKGNIINVSERALAKAQIMLEQLQNEQESEVTGVKPCGGFQTAKGNSIKISEKALAKARSMFQQVQDDGESDETEPKVNIGFQTAEGNSINISEKALAKAHSMFEQMKDEDEPEVIETKVNIGFQTAKGSSINISEKAFAKAHSIFKQMQDEDESENCTTEKFVYGENDEVKLEKRRLEDACSPNTPLKRYKPNGLTKGESSLMTSTPIAFSEAALDEAGNQIDHLFSDLDEREFRHLFVSENGPSHSRITRTTKQVCLATKFDELIVQSPIGNNVSANGHWDDSFGDIMAKLSSELKVTEQILDSRRLARQKQLEYCQNKPSSECMPRLCSFVKKKQQRCRRTLKEFVTDARPVDGGETVPERIRMINLDNVNHFKFDMVRLYGLNFCAENVDGIVLGDDEHPVRLHLDDNCLVGMSELRSAFLSAPGIDPALVPCGWFENAWKWIVSKLSSLERNFRNYFQEITTPGNVLDQLMYRYHREIDCAKRPVIRKILEKDDIPSRRMVLFVARVFRGQVPSDVELELSDGWYSIRTIVDSHLSQVVDKAKVIVGTKLMIQGAELLNLNEGCSPIEVPQDVRLKIHSNSTRRARWDVKLGLYKVPNSFLISCNDILDQGGLISRLQVMVIRVYPLMYVDKSQRNASGAVLRSERAERRRMQEVDADQLKNYQTLLLQVQKEIETEKSACNGNQRSKKLPRTITSTQLLDLLETGVDLSGTENDLTVTQHATVIEHQRRQQEELSNEINRRVRERIGNQTVTNRKVSPLLKIRIMDCRKPEKVLLLSIWRPPDDIGEIMQEGKSVEILNATANGTRNGEVQLTTGKNSTYRMIDTQQFQFREDVFRNLTRIAEIKNTTFRPPFNEFDTVGIIVQVGSSEKKKFQTVYLADTAMNLLCVNFWNGIIEYAYEDVVKERVLLCISNLQWRTINALSSIPNSFATEYTVFSEHPKASHFSEELNNMHSFLSDIDLNAFQLECCSRISELKEKKLTRCNSMNTPGRTADVSTPVRTVLSNTNFSAKTPVDFSPGVGQPMSIQKQKIQLLAAAYKSPPKLTPIIMRSNPRVRKNFRLPIKLEDRIDQTNQDDSVS